MPQRKTAARRPTLPDGPTPEAPLAAWSYLAEDLAEDGLEVERQASPIEREALAKALDLVACGKLVARYTVIPLTGGRFGLEGTLEAKVTQTCGITLEPVDEDVAEPFALEFCPAEDIPAEPNETKETDLELASEDAPEPITGGIIDVGRIVFEYLAQGINPFPRKAGAELEIDKAGDAAVAAKENPFAVLAKLKGETEQPGAGKPGRTRKPRK